MSGIETSTAPLVDQAPGDQAIAIRAGEIVRSQVQPVTPEGIGAATAAQGALAATAVQPGAIAAFETTTQLNGRDTANRDRENHTGTQAANTIADFAAAAAAAAPVQSVAAKTGAVTLTKGDVGLANVDNTSDVAKPISTATQTALDSKAGLASTVGTLTYAATVALDMAALTGTYRTISLTGNLELTTSNRATGRSLSLRLLSDGSSRNLTFPAGWRFLGAARPTAIAAGKVALLAIVFFGSGDADALCAYSVEP